MPSTREYVAVTALAVSTSLLLNTPVAVDVTVSPETKPVIEPTVTVAEVVPS